MTGIARRQLGSCYTVTPGEGEAGPEAFERTLEDLGRAMSRAMHLSVGHGPQQVLLTANGRVKTIMEYRDGRVVSAPPALVPAGGPVPQAKAAGGAVVPGGHPRRKPRPRRPRKAETSWPGISLVTPPCDTSR